MGRAYGLEVVITAKDKLSKVLGKTTKHLTKLHKSSSRIGSSLKRSFKKTQKSAVTLGSKLTRVDRELKTLSGRRLALKDQLKEGTLSAEQLKQKLSLIDRKEAALNQKKLRLTKDLKHSTQEARKLESQLRSVQRRTATINRLNRFDARAHRVGGNLQGAGMKTVAVGMGAGYSLSRMVNTSQEVARAKGDLASLGIKKLGIGDIARQARKYSSKWAGATQAEIIAASYDIKSGISSLSDHDVGRYTTTAAMTALATKSNTATMTKAYSLGYGIFRNQFKNDEDFRKKFSAGTSSFVQRFRTTGDDFALGLSTIGASGTSQGVSFDEQLAVLGVAKGSFNSASEAATSYRALLKGLGKSQKGLKLKFTDKKGHLLPMVNILDKIKHKYKDISKTSVMQKLTKELGSDEAVKMLTALIYKTEELKKAKEGIHSDMEKGVAFTQTMAQERMRGREFELAGQRVGNLSAAIGNLLSPSVIDISNRIGKLGDRLQHWIDNNKEAAKSMGAIAVKTVAATVALGGTALVLGTVMKATKLITSPLRLAIKLFGGLGKSAAGTSGSVCGIGDCASGTNRKLGTLGKTVGKTRSLFATGLVLGVTLVGAGAVLYGLNEISKAAQRDIHIKRRITPIKENLGKLKEKKQDLKQRIIQEEKGGIVERNLPGWKPNTAKIKQLKSLLRQTEHGIKQAATGSYRAPVVPATDALRIRRARTAAGREYAAKMRALHPGTPTQKPVSTSTGYTKPVSASPQAAKALGTSEANRSGIVAQIQAADAQFAAMGGQYQTLAATVQTLAARPEQHQYHINITVNNAKDNQDVVSAVKRAMADSVYQKSQRSLSDH